MKFIPYPKPFCSACWGAHTAFQSFRKSGIFLSFKENYFDECGFLAQSRKCKTEILKWTKYFYYCLPIVYLFSEIFGVFHFPQIHSFKEKHFKFPRSTSSCSCFSFEINDPSWIFCPWIFLISLKLLIIFKMSRFCGIIPKNVCKSIPKIGKSITVLLLLIFLLLVIFDCSLIALCLWVTQCFIHMNMTFSLCHFAMWKNHNLLSFSEKKLDIWLSCLSFYFSNLVNFYFSDDYMSRQYSRNGLRVSVCSAGLHDFIIQN